MMERRGGALGSRRGTRGGLSVDESKAEMMNILLPPSSLELNGFTFPIFP